MNTLTQDNRQLAITDFGLGKDTFLLAELTGREKLSHLFEFSATVLSETPDIDPHDVVGQTATVHIRNQIGRFFNGFVSHFTLGEFRSHGLREYKITLVPWLWFLSKNNNHRIFQDKTTKDIVSEVFSDLGFNDFVFKAEPGLAREYCIQHNESDLHFVSRLLEEEGIAYHFLHENGKHTLVMTDQNHLCLTCDETDLQYSKGSLPEPQITLWERDHALQTGQWTVSDYDFSAPERSLQISAPALKPFHNSHALEHYEYPDLYHAGAGKSQVEMRIEAQESEQATIQAKGECASFYAGGLFTLEKHVVRSEQGEYLIKEVAHQAADWSYLSEAEQKKLPAQGYSNSFTCMPADTPFRPARLHRRPVMRGAQSAVVVGPESEEIYTDEHGRIKVQFQWDRLGKHNEKSSCFLRVMQAWAGNKWGASFIPRVGHEVIVNFLDGDPDRPFVSGSVYNGKNKPPYKSKNQSGIKSRSTKGGSSSNFNEIRFDDTKGAEDLFIQAEKALTLNVKGDSGGTIAGNANNSVAGNADNSVSGNEKANVGGNRNASVAGNENASVAADRMASVGGNETQSVGGALVSTVGGLAKSLIGGPKVENITGPMNQVVAASSSEQVAAVKSITAGGSIMLQCGGASITLNAGGNIEINGTNITINGTTVGLSGAALVNVKAGGVASIMAGAAVSVAGAGLVTVKGGRIDLN